MTRNMCGRKQKYVQVRACRYEGTRKELRSSHARSSHKEAASSCGEVIAKKLEGSLLSNLTSQTAFNLPAHSDQHSFDVAELCAIFT